MSASPSINIATLQMRYWFSLSSNYNNTYSEARELKQEGQLLMSNKIYSTSISCSQLYWSESLSIPGDYKSEGQGVGSKE
jgi:hypothetical protein